MKKIILLFPDDQAEISFASTVQKDFLTDRRRFVPHTPDITPRQNDDTIPAKVIFKFDADEKAEVRISLTEDFSSYQSFCGAGEVQISNLLHGEKYFWQVVGIDSVSEVRSFTVAPDLPRWIDVPHVTNFRDIGNWRAKRGKSIRQGMIYRGGQFEVWSRQSHGSGITNEGMRIFLDTLNIHTEIDLRADAENHLIPVKRYEKIPFQAYASWGGEGVFSAEQMANLRYIFEIFADEKNYPVYFHCQGGGDRTGTLAFLLEALLGMSMEDLLTDYELTNLSVSGERTRFSAEWQGFMEKLTSFAPDSDLEGQVTAFLHQCGISDDTMQKIRDLMLTD